MEDKQKQLALSLGNTVLNILNGKGGSVTVYIDDNKNLKFIHTKPNGDFVIKEEEWRKHYCEEKAIR